VNERTNGRVEKEKVRRSLLGNGERDGVPELARRGWDEEVVRRWGGREAERETTPACLPACA
jgi:hypothetical protein